MAPPAAETLIRHLRAGPADPTPDAELARRFYADGDQDAFELLVCRHAPAVLRVCRCVVGDTHLAEDAAQAVFLILARKARTVAGARSTAAWLIRVAYRAANRARARAASRTTVPLDQAETVANRSPGPADAAATAETAAIVVDEVHRLSDRYLAPVVLCYFQGLTTVQAAERLRWPAGTVAGRLARARKLLRTRLARRGVSLPIAGLAAVLGDPDRAAAVMAAACQLARGTVAPAVGELANEVITMSSTTRRTALAAITLLGVLGMAFTAGAGDPPAKQPPDDQPKPAAAPADPFVVHGRVVDENGKTPMEGVKVWVSSGYGTLRRVGEATTDKDGRFRIGFRPGLAVAGNKVGVQSAVVWATKDGYYAWNYGWPVNYLLTDAPATEKSTSKLTVLTPGSEAQVEFRMAPAASLRAKLTGPDGKPLANTRLWLTGKDLPPASNVIASGGTDANGVWVVPDVPRHAYRLVIDDPRVPRGELELGMVQFVDPVEYTADVTVHALSLAETHISVKVTRPAK
jgi:RNA polymerase sigma factor (sigma-70 family)